MIIDVNPQLKRLAASIDRPLYLVGGSVRNALLGIEGGDIDICSALPPDSMEGAAKACGFATSARYRRTGTLKLTAGDGLSCEYSPLRKDTYSGGGHMPDSVEFTDDIMQDASRRDFTVNAIYYDIMQNKVVDPLCALTQIKQRQLKMCAPHTFDADGLRLMRLVRFAAQLGFYLERDTLNSARANSALIKDISAERIYAELMLILTADQKYPGQSHNAAAHFRGLQLLYYTGIMQHILPELCHCRKLAQPPDYHAYDVFTHSLMAAYSADSDIRFAALLHDIGKAETFKKSGNFLQHDIVGVRMARQLLRRLKAPLSLTREVLFLIETHMYDGDGKTSEKKLRLFIVNNYVYIDKLLRLMRADRLATGKFCGQAAAAKEQKWRALIQKMLSDGTPFTLRQLNIGGGELIAMGACGRQISQTLDYLWKMCIVSPGYNTKPLLAKHAKGYIKQLNK